MPPLAILSGQKSAPERIQAPVLICHFALRTPGPPKPPYASIKEIATPGDIAPGHLPKVPGASTAPRTARVAAGDVAVLEGRGIFVIFEV